MKYCNTCVLPDTRPGLFIHADGQCNACRQHASKPDIDWAEREAAFAQVAQRAKAQNKDYDCLIPVSGGKDSHWQVIKCLEYGLHPLTYTWRPPGRTKIGQKNLDNLINIGVDHLDFTFNPEVEKKFHLLALKKYGSSGIPMHLAIYETSLNLAAKFDIPLVVFGENSAFEYGTDDETCLGFQLDANWKEKFAVCHGTTAADWVADPLTRQDLTPYFGPTERQLAEQGIVGVFLGYYFPWDPETTLAAAAKTGFATAADGPRMGLYDYADIDDYFMSIHHHFKWYKFGFTRLFDNMSLEIRNKRISRAEAVETIRTTGDQTPHSDIDRYCDYVGIDRDHYFRIAETFRNRDIWQLSDGVWKISGFLIDDWTWV